MPKGISDIPDLRLSRLNKLVTTFMTPPNFILQALFGTENEESSTIKWESQQGNRGMTPFIAPGNPAPRTAPVGVAAHSAEAAYWAEKSYYDEEFLNNLRKPGTESTYYPAKQRLARDLMSLRNRCDRRKEYMFSQMLTAGSMTYTSKGGIMLSVDYDLPSDNEVSLGADYHWDTGTLTNIVGDIMDGKLVIQSANGGVIDYAMCNSNVLKLMAMDASIQTLLAKSAYGQGDLFGKSGGGIIGVRPQVMGALLGIQNFVIYDEKYVATRYLSANVAVGASTVTVGDASDFVAGTATLHDLSAGTTESITISSIATSTGVLTLSGVTTGSFQAGVDKITQAVPFIPDTKFLMFASRVDGNRIATFKQAPFGNGRNYGLYTDQWTEVDPDGVYIRVQNKGLPILYNRDALYILTVKD